MLLSFLCFNHIPDYENVDNPCMLPNVSAGNTQKSAEEVLLQKMIGKSDSPSPFTTCQEIFIV